MALDIFDSIRQAEEQAKALVLDAQNSANEVVKNAESAAAETERKAAVRHRALYQQLLDKRREQVAGTLLELEQQAKQHTEREFRQAESKLEEAVAFVVHEVFNGNR